MKKKYLRGFCFPDNDNVDEDIPRDVSEVSIRKKFFEPAMNNSLKKIFINDLFF